MMHEYPPGAPQRALFCCLETTTLTRKSPAKSAAKTDSNPAIPASVTSDAVAVMFTFSFGTAFADKSWTASDVASAYAAEEAAQLHNLAEAKARAIAMYTYDTDGYTSDGLTREALAAAADYIIALAEKAMDTVVDTASKGMGTTTGDNETIPTTAVKDAKITIGGEDYMIAGATKPLTEAANLKAAMDASTEAKAEAYKAQEPISRSFFTSKITSVDLSKYSDKTKKYAESMTGTFLGKDAATASGDVLTTAGYVDFLKAKAVAEISEKAGNTAPADTDEVKAKAYKTIADEFSKLVKTIPTTTDEDYDDTIAKDVAQAVDAYLAYGKGTLYDNYKLVDTNKDGKYIETAASNGLTALKTLKVAIYEAKTPYSKAKLFGVEVADIDKITKAEATAINNAFYKAIMDSAEVVKTYAGDDAAKVSALYQTTKQTPETPAVYEKLAFKAGGTSAEHELEYNAYKAAYKDIFLKAGETYTKVQTFNDGDVANYYYCKTAAVPAGPSTTADADTFLKTLDKAVAAVDVYGKVVELGDAYKAETLYGVKTYEDANVDKAVAEAKKLVYKDLNEAKYKTPAEYISAAAKKLGLTLNQVNYDYQKFEKAMDDAVAKMWNKDTGAPARAVTYGENKTADEDLVYLKGTYATSAADKWEKIAEKAKKEIRNAESYADIEAALKTAAEKFGKLLTAKDEAAVLTARATYKKALGDFVDGQKKIMGTTNYSVESFTAAKADGEKLIDKANTVANVEAAYKEAQGIVTGIKTKTELKTMKDALVAQIAALPKANAMTATDKAAVVAAFDAYKTYVETPGASDVLVNKNVLKDALETVYTLEGKDLRAKLDAVEKEIKKLSIDGNPISDAANVELAAKRAEYQALYDAIDTFNKEIVNDDETGVNDYFTNLVNQIDLNKLEAALYAENAVWRGEARNVDVLAVKASKASASVADMKAALDAYNKLTDRQKYWMDYDVYEMIKRVEANLSDAVKAIKITTSSKATKGAITVKWTVKAGDAEAADGFQIWKSTKTNSGYKKAFTTTKTSYKNTKGLKKGTRYYYKVRAYRVVDGKNVYSDWSNKAYRKAK